VSDHARVSRCGYLDIYPARKNNCPVKIIHAGSSTRLMMSNASHNASLAVLNRCNRATWTLAEAIVEPAACVCTEDASCCLPMLCQANTQRTAARSYPTARDAFRIEGTTWAGILSKNIALTTTSG
jgi:hypothetical protein